MRLRGYSSIGVFCSLILASVSLAACGGSDSTGEETTATAGCATSPAAPRTTLTYEVGDEATAGETAAIVCDRLDALDIDGEVAADGDDRITVTLSDDDAGSLSPALTSEGLLYFYDLEGNVVPREAGLVLGEVTSAELEAQATPSRLEATELAAEQQPAPCDGCSSPTTALYLFEKGSDELVAGPAPSEAELLDFAEAQSVSKADRVVLGVPVGTVVVEDQPADGGRKQYFVLRDDPALTGADVTDPEQDFDPYTSQPNVTFGFTDAGQAAFHDVTRDIAQRGLESGEPASLAIVLNDRILSRPIIDPEENPDGIDGSTGAQVSGDLTVDEAQQLAALLETGALPAPLELVDVEAEG